MKIPFQNLWGNIATRMLAFGAEGDDAKVVSSSTPLPVRDPDADKFTETFALATANTAATPATLYGGTYIVEAVSGAWGTITLRKRGPDGVTMVTAYTFSANGVYGDFKVGPGAIVDVALTSTTGAYVTISRVRA